MDVIKFPVSTTNIFPLANSTAGGQLLTEFNLKSRESVATNPNIEYFSGLSYVHSPNDFSINKYADSTGAVISSSAIEIAPGRCIIDGYYFESLTPIVVDIAELNSIINADKTHTLNNGQPLKGKIAVGLRVMYSTTATMNGSMLTENKENYYEGIQVVVSNAADFVLPEDSPTDPSKVTAHIKLGEFNYRNGAVVPASIVNNVDKIKYIDSARLKDVEGFLSSIYITKTGLVPGKLYVYSGKGSKGGTISEADTWCDATDALVDWGNVSSTTDKPSVETGFITNELGQVFFIAARKQVDGYTNAAGNQIYFTPVSLPLPVADFSNNTAGTVNSKYTKHVKSVLDKIHELYNLPGGKQRAYYNYFPLDGKTGSADSLPPIGSTWNIGDYVIVRQDNTINSTESPSTMYVVIPGTVLQITNNAGLPEGTRLDYLSGTEDPTEIIQLLTTSNISYYTLLTQAPADFTTNFSNYYMRNDSGEFPELIQLTQAVEFENNRFYKSATIDAGTVAGYPVVTNPSFNLSNYSGVPGKDYFQYDKLDEAGNVIATYYFVVSQATASKYSDAILLTGNISLATQTQVGGFYDTDSSNIDNGYVTLTDDGRLQLIDYALLRSGVLAYQLGQNYTLDGTNLSADEIQSALDDYVNNRVVFPNASQIASATENNTNPNRISLTITLKKSEEPQTYYIRGLDSRFGGIFELVILGDADSNTTINISDCEKLKIDNNIGGTPVVNVYRSSLYYDAGILDDINILEDIHFWYQQFSDDDPNLTVNDMTISVSGDPIVTEDLIAWNNQYNNDNHYTYGLKSITFDSSGSIVGVGIFISNNTTSNVDDGMSGIISSTFALPQGIGLTYPVTRLKHKLKVSGEFVSAYSSKDGYIVTNCRFSAITSEYDKFSTVNYAQGKIAIYFTTDTISNIVGELNDNIMDNPFYPGTYHIFYGGTLGGGN